MESLIIVALIALIIGILVGRPYYGSWYPGSGVASGGGGGSIILFFILLLLGSFFAPKACSWLDESNSAKIEPVAEEALSMGEENPADTLEVQNIPVPEHPDEYEYSSKAEEAPIGTEKDRVPSSDPIYTVQLGAFGNEENAEILLDRVCSVHQVKGWIFYERDNLEVLHKVRIGIFQDVEAAKLFQSTLMKDGFEDSLIDQLNAYEMDELFVYI